MYDSNKLKEGLLKKASWYTKVWSERWTVLTELKLFTFVNQGVYSNPNEVIDIKTIKTVKTDESKKGFNFVIKNIISKFFLLIEGYYGWFYIFLNRELLKKKKLRLALLEKLWLIQEIMFFWEMFKNIYELW